MLRTHKTMLEGAARLECKCGAGMPPLAHCAVSGRQVQRTMLELLNQLDGFEATNQIKVIMATNRLDSEQACAHVHAAHV